MSGVAVSSPSKMTLTKTCKCIFVQIPKTGGTSVKSAVKTIEGNHEAWAWYAKNYPEQWKELPSFSIVRNPWDRAVSSWLFYKKKGKHPVDMTLRETLEKYASPKGASGAEGQIYYHQADFVLNDQGHLMVGRLLRFERLQLDFDALCNSLDEPQRTLPHMNDGYRRGSYRQYYDNETRELVGELYERDIKAFCYQY